MPRLIVTQPSQPGSVNDLLRQHCHDRLYVKPLHWTPQHLELMRCRFARRPCASLPARFSHSESEQQRRKDFKRIYDIDLQQGVRRLAYEDDIISKQWALDALLKVLSNDRASYQWDDLELYFAGKPVAALPVRVFSLIIDSVKTSFLAYIDQDTIATLREKSVKFRRGRVPVWRIRLAILARLQPTNIEQDPYLVGLLIALAQERKYANPDSAIARQSSHAVYLLVTNRKKPGLVLLYTATIFAAFLRKFDQPSTFSDGSLVIHHKRIPLSSLEYEIAAIVKPPRGKKRQQMTKQRSSERIKALRDRFDGKKTIYGRSEQD